MDSPQSAFVLGVAANVRAEAARLGINQQDLARRAGMAQSTVSIRWNGRRQWQLEDLEAVAQVLGTTPSALCQVERARQDSNVQPTVYNTGAGGVVVPFPGGGAA